MKFIGTIIDQSYLEPWKDKDEVYKICLTCDRPKLMLDKNGFNCQKRHACDKERLSWVDFLRIELDGFVFIPAK